MTEALLSSQSDGILIGVPTDPNAAQRRASHPRHSVWVSASAGSGKTKVLTDRVTRLLLDDVRPEKILCLTFTRAAAAEMAVRVTERLARWATVDEEVLRQDLDLLQDTPPSADQLTLARRLFSTVLSCPGGMRIKTIHAFCQEILRRFPLEAGVSPHFVLLDEAEAKSLYHDARDALLHRAASSPDAPEGKALSLLVRSLGEDSFTSLLLEALFDKTKLLASVEKYGGLEGLVHHWRARLDMADDEDETTLLNRAISGDSFDEEKLRDAARTVLEKGSKDYQEGARIILMWLELDPSGRTAKWDSYTDAFLTKNKSTNKRTIRAKFANKHILEKNPEIDVILRREAVRILSLEERRETLARLLETEALLTLVLSLAQEIAKRKALRGALDYDDLIEKTDALLRRPSIAPWVLYKLDGGLDHILVDEAQDTNPLQWSIVKSLVDEFFAGKGSKEDVCRTLFVVGDEKQSIFSFQKADPEAFLKMRHYFEERIIASGAPFDPVPLNVSFRSAPAILRAVDAVFADDNVRAGVSETPVHHEAFHRDVAGIVELWPLNEIEAKRKDEDAEKWDMPVGYEGEKDPVAELAEGIADKIHTWIVQKETIYDRKAKAHRLLKPGDVMVLVQNRDAFVYHLVRALKEREVAVTGVDRMHLVSQLAVMDILALLQFVLLPDDNLNLATLLKGPFLGCSEERLMEVAVGRSGTLWQSVQAHAEADGVWQKIYDYLADFLAMADRLSPFAMIMRLLLSPCPADKISGRRALWCRLGPDALDPIQELLTAAQDFGGYHGPSLQDFLHWMMATEAEIKREMDQGAGQVRITTVHASKGLEAPIVIIADATRLPSKNKLKKLLWDDARHLPFYIPRDPANAFFKTLREKARQKQMEEYRRLLYVALTRPADRLIVAGWRSAKKEREDASVSWHEMVNRALSSGRPENPDALPADAILSWQDDLRQDKSIVLASVQEAKEAEEPLPVWAYAPPPAEPTPPKPLTPSRASETEEAPAASPSQARFLRGRLIHRLLQTLPDVPVPDRSEAAFAFLQKTQHGLTQAEREEIEREVSVILSHPAYAPLFGPGSLAEVPVVGRTEDRLIAGQVDRLWVTEDEVWIVDYKTNRPPPQSAEEVPVAYKAQLVAYKKVLEKVYVGKRVKGFLLWTYGPTFMEVDLSAC